MISQTLDIDSLQELAQQALLHWHITPDDCTPQLIKHRENTVYKIQMLDGKPAVLRIHRYGYHNDAELLSELQWMQMLSKAGMTVPTPIPTKDNDLFIALPAADGTRRQIDILSWVDGTTLGITGQLLEYDKESLHILFYQLGQQAAKLHNLSDSWDTPTGFTRHAWDIQGLLGEQPFWGAFWNVPDMTTDECKLIQKARSQAKQDLSIYQNNGHDYGLIHADLVKENVLVSGNQIHMIDFDDAGFGWRLFELVTILFGLRNEPHYQLIETTLLDGYQSQRKLHESALAALPLFRLLRSFTYIGWCNERRDEKDRYEQIRDCIDHTCDLAEQYLT